MTLVDPLRWSGVKAKQRGFLFKRCGSTLLVALALAAGTPASAATTNVDPLTALPILLRVLTYDRNFRSRGAGEFVVLVPGEAGKEASRDDVLVAVKTLGLNTIHNRPLKFVSADFKDAAALDDAVQKSRAQAILAVPGLVPATVKAISEVAQTNQIYTLALDFKFVETSLALGVAPKDDGKPQIVINLVAAKAVGAVFENSVLKLARLVQEK
jgi:hypothetical protein